MVDILCGDIGSRFSTKKKVKRKCALHTSPLPLRMFKLEETSCSLSTRKKRKELLAAFGIACVQMKQ
jgi:hypothetical protein